MNEIGIIVPPRRDDADYEVAEILIDGTRLIDRLRLIELPYATAEGSPQIAGDYLSLPRAATFFPSRHLLGGADALMRCGSKTVLLLCSCGCPGCWDFVCNITTTPQAVIWSDFEHVHRKIQFECEGTSAFTNRLIHSRIDLKALDTSKAASELH